MVRILYHDMNQVGYDTHLVRMYYASSTHLVRMIRISCGCRAAALRRSAAAARPSPPRRALPRWQAQPLAAPAGGERAERDDGGRGRGGGSARCSAAAPPRRRLAAAWPGLPCRAPLQSSVQASRMSSSSMLCDVPAAPGQHRSIWKENEP
jgi:hypothetical protein